MGHLRVLEPAAGVLAFYAAVHRENLEAVPVSAAPPAP
jgi:hypothetical protein